MQNEKTSETKFIWKSLDNNISVTHFSSTAAIDDPQNRGQIYVKKYEAIKNDPNKKITVFLLHDIGQYHGRFLRLIDWMRIENPGVSFIAIDFIGHGLSSGTRGHFEKFDHLVGDFLHVLTTVKKDQLKNEKWIVLGHGMGGLVALDLLNRFQSSVVGQIDGLILSNFILKLTSTFLNI